VRVHGSQHWLNLRPIGMSALSPFNRVNPEIQLCGEPSLLAEIEYRAKSAEGKVRHPFFEGIREDR